MAGSRRRALVLKDIKDLLIKAKAAKVEPSCLISPATPRPADQAVKIGAYSSSGAIVATKSTEGKVEIWMIKTRIPREGPLVILTSHRALGL